MTRIERVSFGAIALRARARLALRAGNVCIWTTDSLTPPSCVAVRSLLALQEYASTCLRGVRSMVDVLQLALRGRYRQSVNQSIDQSVSHMDWWVGVVLDQ